MKIERNITVELTPKEVSKIIIQHLKEVDNIDIKDVDFHITTRYGDYMDQHGTDEVSKIICYGTLSSDGDK